MLVVVPVVGGVPAPVMHVVDVIAVRDRHMSAPLAVNVVMLLMDHVTGGFAFVEVTVVASVKMTAVRVVDVIAMRDRDVPAPVAVKVVMTEMLMVSKSVHLFLQNAGATTMHGDFVSAPRSGSGALVGLRSRWV